ncbi:MAG: hypothetical protein HYZ29_23265 [Myxococcales bacterium]|nr:hypothetical protein [Myxococcales bacterium]
MKPTERPRTKREEAAERRRLGATLRKLDRQKLARLKEELKAARAQRRRNMATAVEFCREGRRKVRERAKERRLRALAELKEARKAEAERASDACRGAKDAARAESGVSEAERSLEAERQSRRTLATIERSDRSRERERGKKRATAAERRGESDDAVRSNLSPELVPVFNLLRRNIKPTARMSRTEVFLKWAEENPGEVVAIQDADAERAVAELIRERQATEKQLRSRKRYRRSADELAAELAEKEEEEVPF